MIEKNAKLTIKRATGEEESYDLMEGHSPGTFIVIEDVDWPKVGDSFWAESVPDVELPG